VSAFVWDADMRARARENARMWPAGIWTTLAGLSDLLDAAETRAAHADALQTRIDAVEALHRPELLYGALVCPICMDSRGANHGWPCDTAEAMSARGES
jgi:hypothetical protein